MPYPKDDEGDIYDAVIDLRNIRYEEKKLMVKKIADKCVIELYAAGYIAPDKKLVEAREIISAYMLFHLP